MNMSCRELGDIVQHDESPMGWREFQEEIKKSRVLTGVGVQQVLAGALKSRVNELDRREFMENSSNPKPSLLQDESLMSEDSSSRRGSSWSDSFRKLSMDSSSSSLRSKRGTMSMLIHGLMNEVQETPPPSTSKSTTPVRRRPTASNVSPRRGFLSSQEGSKRNSMSPCSSFRHAKVVDGARRSTMAYSLSSRNNSKFSDSNVRRGSVLADVMTNLGGEQRYSTSQAMAQGTYLVNQRGNMFVSTSDYSDVIRRREVDSETIQTFKRSTNGSYTAADMKSEGSFIVAVIGSAYENAKASVKSARSA